MKVFGLKTCDTCKKALKELAAFGHDVTYVDVRSDSLSDAERARILAEFGAAAINRASTTWRGLSEVERETDPEELLKAHPTLMKRPVIEDGDRWTLGWKADAKAVWLGE